MIFFWVKLHDIFSLPLFKLPFISSCPLNIFWFGSNCSSFLGIIWFTLHSLTGSANLRNYEFISQVEGWNESRSSSYCYLSVHLYLKFKSMSPMIMSKTYWFVGSDAWISCTFCPFSIPCNIARIFFINCSLAFARDTTRQFDSDYYWIKTKRYL